MLPCLRAPIVLVHGLLGVSRVRVGSITLSSYFPGIWESLEKSGNRVLVPQLSLTAGVDDRAQQLKQFIERNSPREPVHIVAHSMGGLDARYMISCLDMGSRVLTLTTLGTPHRGTTFADWGVSRLARVVRPIFQYLGMPTQAFVDLTTSACRAFNERVRDVPGVRYFSVAGKHDGRIHTPEFLLPHGIVMDREGPNDGVVAISSASYGECKDIWEGDHFSLVNWSHPFSPHRGRGRDLEKRYGHLLGRLVDLGF